MTQAFQTKLDDLAAKHDPRTSVFDLKIAGKTNGTLSLSGRVLESAQLDEVQRLFPDLKLDTASIKVLQGPSLPRLSVATNLTGLYEKPTFGMPLASELCFGTQLDILEEQGRWVFTRQKDGYLGWAYKPYLKETISNETHLVLAPSVELHQRPDEASEVLTRLVSGTGVTVEKTDGEWSYVVANRSGWVPSSDLRNVKDIPASVEEKRKTMVADAHRMIGIPYLWGGISGNGIDCSGYARLLHRWVGVEIPRDADQQCDAAKRVEEPFQVGDLLFFGEGDSERRVTHVGVSLGGWKMIHSSRGNNGVYIDDVEKSKSLMEIYMSTGSYLR
jgi:cell wall-associated NlpC family hydrolase